MFHLFTVCFILLVYVYTAIMLNKIIVNNNNNFSNK